MAVYSSFKKIDSNAIVDLNLATADLANSAVDNAAIADSNVTAAKLNTGAVTSDKLNSTLDISSKTVTYRPLVNNDISNTAAIAGAKLASGAATTNLGYNPVNVAGDTMTGTLQVNPANFPAITATDGDTGLGWASGDSGQFYIRNNANTAIETDPSGRVRWPRKPAFTAVGQPGWLYSSNFGGTGAREQGSVMNWLLSAEYGGSNFNTSTGRFTAPYSGWYHFSTFYYLLNDNNSTSSYVHLFHARNGSLGTAVGGRAPYTINMHGNRNNYDPGASYNAVYYLNAGQYVSNFVVWHSFNSRMHAGHQIFSGELIG